MLSGAAIPANAANYTKNDINTKSRSTVSAAYSKAYVKAEKTPVGWTGKVKGCKAGATSKSHISASTNLINFYRGLNGLEKVSTSKTYNSQAQAAALIMQANNMLSHGPTKKWKCYTTAGAIGAGTGNLYGGSYGTANSAQAVEAYMDDFGYSNTDVGHRRWLLNPSTSKMGIGSTHGFNSIKVFDTAKHKKYANPSFIPFPNANYSPAQLEPNGRWSFTKPNANFSKATIKVYDYSAKKWLKVKKHSSHNGYADNTVAFEVSNVSKNVNALVGTSKTRKYKVEIKGIKVGAKVYNHTYSTRFFDGKKAK